METLRVASSSSPKSVAGAIIAIIEQKGTLALTTVGAGAVNQAVKAIAIARSYMSTRNLNLLAEITFSRTFIENLEKTAIKFVIVAQSCEQIEE
jgi:stage V sporulation protein S